MRGVTNSAGAKAERTLYRPYGNWADNLTWQFAGAGPVESHGYIGERLDADAGLLFLNAPYMDPQLGMFTQPDWWEVTNPGVGTNRYAYAGGDPVNGSDPGGNSTYVQPDIETDRTDDYTVMSVLADDGDLNIYVQNGDKPKSELQVIGQTRFVDAFVSPDTENAVGKVYLGLSFDSRFASLANSANDLNAFELASLSLPGQQMDVKSTTAPYTSYSGMLLDGKYMTLREIGNALAGHNAARNGQSFDDFQRVSGALHAAGVAGALKAYLFGTSYGTAPNYGEVDYQRTRSEYGYQLDRTIVAGWLK